MDTTPKPDGVEDYTQWAYTPELDDIPAEPLSWRVIAAGIGVMILCAIGFITAANGLIWALAMIVGAML